jgi:Flp pilus assembly protein TadB
MSVIAAGSLAAALAAICAILAPFARSTPALNPRVAHPDARMLDVVNWRRSLWDWEGVRAACIVACAALCLATPLPLAAIVALGALAPSVAVRWRGGTVRRRARSATTHLLRTSEAALRSGASLPESLRRAIEATDDRLARRPFFEALRGFDLGAPLDQALRASALVASDSRSRVALETIAMGITSRLPFERAGILVGAVADRLAFEDRVDEEVRARTGGLRAQVVLLAMLVPAIALYLAATVPSLAATLDRPIGRFVLIPAALTLEVVGVIVSRRAFDGAAR